MPVLIQVRIWRLNCTALQPDGKIIIGGTSLTVAGATRNRIARLNADGTLDTSFNPSVSAPVYSVVLSADGRIIVGGAFGLVGGEIDHVAN